jgi:DNA-binding NarL/FixJ family response regulator
VEYRNRGTEIRIVIAEDYTILREGLKSLFSSQPDFVIVGEAEDGMTAVRLAEEFKPDLILTDISMPRMTGMEAIREIKKVSPNSKILVLTVHKSEEYVLATIQAGADGYVLKDSTSHELVIAIRMVLAGTPYLSPGISSKAIEEYGEGNKKRKTNSFWEVVTPREREVMKLVAEGYKTREIAHQLYISEKTVERHRANLMEKLDLHSVQALTAMAIEKGLVEKRQ